MYVKYFHFLFTLTICPRRLSTANKIFKFISNAQYEHKRDQTKCTRFSAFFLLRHKVTIWWRADLLIYLHCVIHVHCTHIDHMQVSPRQRVKTDVWEDSPLGRPHRMWCPGVPKKVTFWFFLVTCQLPDKLLYFSSSTREYWKNNDLTQRWLVIQKIRK